MIYTDLRRALSLRAVICWSFGAPRILTVRREGRAPPITMSHNLNHWQ